ncbi:hypothetical protein, partial [Ruegeria sp. HKCCD8929]|uniref:hypothetical protein n=1 Tax=Ruegeria sp. HKCCD8929 TaxID=2683006 RepID=UPI001C2C2D06
TVARVAENAESTLSVRSLKHSPASGRASLPSHETCQAVEAEKGKSLNHSGVGAMITLNGFPRPAKPGRTILIFFSTEYCLARLALDAPDQLVGGVIR